MSEILKRTPEICTYTSIEKQTEFQCKKQGVLMIKKKKNKINQPDKKNYLGHTVYKLNTAGENHLLTEWSVAIKQNIQNQEYLKNNIIL